LEKEVDKSIKPRPETPPAAKEEASPAQKTSDPEESNPIDDILKKAGKDAGSAIFKDTEDSGE
jgi:hypothetical protein